jgi:TP901 family phage tail tape measure protein
LAQTTTQAKLGLLISAKDEASKVFSEFAKNVKADMETIQKSIKEGLKMDGVSKAVQDDTKKITESFKNVEEATKELKNTKFGEKMAEQMKEIREGAKTMAESVSKNFKSVESAAKKVGKAGSDMHSKFKFGDMLDAGMQLQQTGEKGLGFFIAAAESGAEFDQSIKNATSSLNANRRGINLTSGQISDMGDKALKMGSDGFFSANQIAEAMNTMAKQGISYQDIMGGGISVVKKVAAANQQDLEETANVVSDIMNEMGDSFKGLSTKVATQNIGTAMTVALHHARLSMGDFLQTMKYVGPQASAAGMSIQDVSAAIAVLGQHGIKGSQAGTTLRRMLTNLTPASKESAAMMKQLGMITADGSNIFYDGAGKMKSMTEVQGLLHDHLAGLNPQMQQFAIKTIFGQYALSGMTAIVNTHNSTFKELTKEMKNNAEMDQIMATKKQGLMMKIQGVTAHFQTLQKEIGIMLMPILTKLIDAAQGIMKAWDHLSKPVKQAIVIFGAVTSAIMVVGGTILTCIGLFGMFVGSFANAMLGLSRVLSVLRMMSPPILIAVGLIAALAYAWKHDVGGIREVVSKFVEWFKPIFGHTFTKAKSDVLSGLHTITAGFTGWQKNIMVPVNKGVNFILHSFVNGLKTVVTAVSAGVTAVTGWFKKMAPDINKAMQNIMAFFTKHTGTWKALWNVFKFVVSLVWDWIIGIIKHAWGLFSGIVQLFVHIINGQWKKVFQDLWQIIKNAFLLVFDLWGGALGKFLGFFGKIIAHTGIFGKAFGKIFSGAFKLAEKVADGMWKFVEKLFKYGVKVVGSVLKPFHGMIGNIWHGISSFVSSHSSAAMNAFKKAFHGLVSIGKTLVGGLWIEIKAIWTGIKTFITSHSSAAMNGLKTAFHNGVMGVKLHLHNFVGGVKTTFNNIKMSIMLHVNHAVAYLMLRFHAGVMYVKNTIAPWVASVSRMFLQVKAYISTHVNAAMNFLKDKFHAGVTHVKTTLSGWFSSVKTVFTNVKTHIMDHVNKAIAYVMLRFYAGVMYVKNTLAPWATAVSKLFQTVKTYISTHVTAAMDFLKSKFTAGVNNVKKLLSTWATAVSKTFNQVKTWISSHVTSAMDFLKSKFNAGVTFVKNLLTSWGTAVKTAFNNVKTSISSHVTSAMNFLQTKFHAGVTYVKGIITPWVSAVSKLFSNVKTYITTHVDQAITRLKLNFYAGVMYVKNTLSPWTTAVGKLFSNVKAFIVTHVTAAMDFLKNKFTTGVTNVKNLVTPWVTAISKLFSNVKSFIVTHVTGAVDFLKTKFTTGVANVKTLLTNWYSAVKSLFTNIKTTITTHVTGAVDFLKSKFTTGVANVKSAITTFMNAAKSIFSSIKKFITNDSGAAMNYFKKVFSSEISVVKTIINGLKTGVSSVFTAIKSLISGNASGAMTALKNAFSAGINMAKGVIKGLGGIIDSVLGGLPSKMLSWGKNAMGMFVKGLKSGISAIGSAVSAAANKIKDFLGFHSPTKMGPAARGESDQWMPNMMKMLSKGIDDNKDKVQKSTHNVALGIASTFSGTQDVIHKAVSGTGKSQPAVTNHNRTNRQVVVNINVDGRSKQTDKQLIEELGRQFRTQMSMVLS